MWKVIIISLIMVMALPAFAQRKDTVLIYNIPITFEKSIFVDARRKSEEEKFDYYAVIIPQTIAKNLDASGKIRARKIDGELPLKDIGSDEFYDEMQKIGGVQGAQYIIGGRATVRGNKLALELAIVNIRNRDFVAIYKDSFETGAEFVTTVNDLSATIEQKLGMYMKETKQQVAVSPFLKAYRALSGFSFGVKTGRVFIKGSFSKVYEDTTCFTPYLSLGIVKWFGLSAEADYIAFNNGSTTTAAVLKQRSSMNLWGVSLNADFTYRFFDYFGIRLAAGGGISLSTIQLDSSDNPFTGITSTRKSRDPYLNIAVSGNFRYRPIEIQAGGAYKAVFFKGRNLSMLAVFFGIGFHI